MVFIIVNGQPFFLRRSHHHFMCLSLSDVKTFHAWMSIVKEDIVYKRLTVTGGLVPTILSPAPPLLLADDIRLDLDLVLA